MNGPFEHVPVLRDEIVDILITNPSGWYVDGTLGGGGHAAALLERLSQSGRVIGIDKDTDAIAASRERLSSDSDRILFLQGDFMNIKEILGREGIEAVDGVLFDLGVSSYQINTAERGFSYMHDGPLDMRMDKSSPVTAAMIVNGADVAELERIFRDYGEERLARPIARRIVATRLEAPIDSTRDLVQLIRAVVRHGPLYKSCSRVFQALRITVNNELLELGGAVSDSVGLLVPGGRLAVISYHSLEDRVVKRTMRDLARTCICPPRIPQCVCGHEAKVKTITRKPIYPSPEEVLANSRSRSARLRCVERLSPVRRDNATAE